MTAVTTHSVVTTVTPTTTAYKSLHGLKWVGTPFLGPPFLQSGIPRQASNSAFFCGNARSRPERQVYPW